jgi:hypothetical protein
MRGLYLYIGFGLIVGSILVLIEPGWGFFPGDLETKGPSSAIVIAGLGLCVWVGSWVIMNPAIHERDVKELQDEIDLREMTEASPE